MKIQQAACSFVVSLSQESKCKHMTFLFQLSSVLLFHLNATQALPSWTNTLSTQQFNSSSYIWSKSKVSEHFLIFFIYLKNGARGIPPPLTTLTSITRGEGRQQETQMFSRSHRQKKKELREQYLSVFHRSIKKHGTIFDSNKDNYVP